MREVGACGAYGRLSGFCPRNLACTLPWTSRAATQRHDGRRGRRFGREIGREALASFAEVALVDDVVALEHARRLPAADTLDHMLIHACVAEVPRPGAAEIVEERRWEPDRGARLV